MTGKRERGTIYQTAAEKGRAGSQEKRERGREGQIERGEEKKRAYGSFKC